MKFDSDVFISYAHLDNAELMEGHKGWVANFHRALEIRVSQLLGKQPDIWRDPKLKGSDFFENTLVERVRRVAVLLTVITPRYVKSEWTRRELLEFWKSASEAGGVSVGDKSRVFKVVKTPVPLEMQPSELQRMLGYEFYRIDPETGRIRELDHIFGPEAQRDFWMKIDDVAHDLATILQTLHETDADETPEVDAPPVYLAETTSDLQTQYDSVRRDLQQHGYKVVPTRPLPLRAPELDAFLRAELERCGMSVHLIGPTYGLVPEGGTTSVTEMQHEVAVDRGERGSFQRLLWMPPGLESDDPRQQRLIDTLRTDARFLTGADLLETTLDNLQSTLLERLSALRRTPEPKPTPTAVAAPATTGADEPDDELTRVYVVCDQRDQEAVRPWADFLFDEGLEVIPSIFEGDETEVREYHEESLRLCDGVFIYYGAANEPWLRRKLREVQKIAGYGRNRPMRAVAVCVAPPVTPPKAQFRTREAMVVSQPEGLTPETLRPFLDRLRDAGAPRSA